MKSKLITKIMTGVMVLSTFMAMPVYAETTTVVNGTINASTFDVSVSSNATYTINPNAEDGSYFTDVLSTDVGTGTKEEWYALGATDSKAKIALALKELPEKSIWRNKVRTTDIFFKEILDLQTEESINLGTVNAGDTVTYSLDGFHGLAFNEGITNTNTITWSVAIADE